MNEPYLSQFVELIRSGAAAQDIHGEPDEPGTVADRFIRRELERVELHRASLIPLLLAHGALKGRVLDVGCSTGGTTAALAGHADEVVGIDPNGRSIAAASIRLQGLGIGNAWVTTVQPGPLPFESGSFDLVTCVSVLEFVPDGRDQFLAELQRVVKPGGYVYLSTPNPWALRELHSGRLLGNQRRKPDQPWASSRWAIRCGLDQCDAVSVDAWVVRDKLGLGIAPLVWVMPWQKLLFRRRA